MTPRGQCQLRRGHKLWQAQLLDAGNRYCAFHEPDAARAGVQRCEGTVHTHLKGRADLQCKVTSANEFLDALPLTHGGRLCKHHLWQGWEPPTECTGYACRIS